MLTKVIYVVVDCIAVLDIYFTYNAVDRINEKYGMWLKKAFISAIVAIFANMLIAFSFNSLCAEIAYCVYFASIDWIIYFLVGFCLQYTLHDTALSYMYRPAAVVMCVDSLSIFLNFVFRHEFVIFEKVMPSGTVFYQTTYQPYYYVHLTVDYIAIAIALFFIVSRIVKSYSLYRVRYLIILSVLILVIVLNIVYMAFGLVLDASVIFYAVAGTLIYFCTEIFVPRGLMNASIGRAVNDMNEGLILFDINDNCIYANVFSRERFNINEQTYDLTCEPVANVISSLKDLDAIYGETTYIREQKTGDAATEEHYRIRYNVLTDQKSRRIGSYFLIEDTTEEARYLREISEAKNNADAANRAKSTFLANMSHEIRTPLNSIIGMNEMILRTSDDPQTKDYAESIRVSGETLLSIINDILDFSKIEANRMDLNRTVYNMHNILRDCFNYFEQPAEEKDLFLDIKCDNDLPAGLIGDEKLVRQVISNIISNAIKYTKDGGVSVSVRAGEITENAENKENDHTADAGGLKVRSGIVMNSPSSQNDTGVIRNIEITVKDTGIGISSDDIRYLFDAFRRVNEKENATIQGTGLGLAITKELITLMNGTVDVESMPGEGTTFYIVLPQGVADPAPVGEFVKHIETKNKEYKESFHAPDARILIVDDAKLNLKVVQALLKKTGLQSDTADSGTKAIEMCRETKYDVILLDHRMPEPDGIETFKVISKEGINTKTPVIMLTANALTGAEEEYIEMGFAGYISKPVHGEDLEAALMRFLPEDKVTRL